MAQGGVMLVDVGALRARIADEINTLGKNILDGGCADYEDYKGKTGQIKAFKKALGLLGDIINMKGNDDD